MKCFTTNVVNAKYVLSYWRVVERMGKWTTKVFLIERRDWWKLWRKYKIQGPSSFSRTKRKNGERTRVHYWEFLHCCLSAMTGRGGGYETRAPPLFHSFFPSIRPFCSFRFSPSFDNFRQGFTNTTVFKHSMANIVRKFDQIRSILCSHREHRSQLWWTMKKDYYELERVACCRRNFLTQKSQD